MSTQTQSGLKVRLGLSSREAERSLWLIGTEFAAFHALSGLIDEIEARDSRIRLILSSSMPDVLAMLQQQYPAARVLPLPFSNRLSLGLHLRRLNIRTLAFVEGAARMASRPLLSALKRRAIGVVTLSGRGIQFLPVDETPVAIGEAYIVVENGAGQRPRPEGKTRLTVAKTADLLTAMLARDLKALRDENAIARTVARFPLNLAASPRWRNSVAWRVRRFRDAQELRQRLATPKVILCLGNGPSSEYPALEEMKFDALFRVNHSWHKREKLANPDVVFTGGRPTMRAVSGSIFGLPTPDTEMRMILTRVFNPLVGSTEFFNTNDMTSALRQFPWGHLRPTNGASMLAAAVALKPEKLIVAGIDLFRHPEGSYPGDNDTPNAYSPGHSRETELDFILGLLADFGGEVVIVGEILREAWEMRAHKPVNLA